MLPKQRPIGEIIAAFKFQSRRDDCWAVCIYNILREMSERTELESLRLSETKLNRAMGYGGGLGALSIRPERVTPNLNRQLKPFHFELREANEVRFDGLRANLGNSSVSHPIAGLSYQYLRDKKPSPRISFEGEVPEGVDHAAIVIEADAASVTLFDPLERFGKGAKGIDGIITLSTPAFLRYWTAASVEREWLMYLAPLPKRGSTTLDDELWEKSDATQD